MKNAFMVLIVIAGMNQAFSALPISFVSAGFGGKIGAAFTDNAYVPNYAGEFDAAFDVGAHGDFTFSMGQIGWLHYYPSLGAFFSFDEQGSLDFSIVEVYFNVADIKYQPPLSIPIVKPFIGVGPMFCMQRENWERWEWINGNQVVVDYHDNNAEFGFNFMAGCDFQFTPSFALTAEFRGRPSSGWDAFKMLAGATFTIK